MKAEVADYLARPEEMVARWAGTSKDFRSLYFESLWLFTQKVRTETSSHFWSNPGYFKRVICAQLMLLFMCPGLQDLVYVSDKKKKLANILEMELVQIFHSPVVSNRRDL